MGDQTAQPFYFDRSGPANLVGSVGIVCANWLIDGEQGGRIDQPLPQSVLFATNAASSNGFANRLLGPPGSLCCFGKLDHGGSTKTNYCKHGWLNLHLTHELGNFTTP